MSGIGRAAEAVSAEVDAADALHQKFDHSHLDASSSQEKVSDRKADTSSEEYDDLGDIPDGCTLPTEEVSESPLLALLFPCAPYSRLRSTPHDSDDRCSQTSLDSFSR